MSRKEEPEDFDVGLGNVVYDEDGQKLGTIRGLDEAGFFVTFEEGMEELSLEHVRSSSAFGEAELMWRCTTCGEMGRISGGLPDACPNCGSAKEDLMYWTED
jgi:rubrerythrin